MDNKLKICACGNPSETQHRKSGLIVYRGICTQCLIRKRRNIPDYVNKKWLLQKHITENLSLEQISNLLEIRESHILYFFKLYKIKEIKHCRYCNTTNNLRNCIVNNKWMEEKQSTHKICQTCYEREKSRVQKQAVKYTDYQKGVEKRKQLYIDNLDKKKKETEKSKETKANKTEEEKEQWKQNISISKQNRTEEQRNLSTEKLRETISIMPEEERQQWLSNMGNAVSEAHTNKPKEEWDEIIKRRQDNFIDKFGVPYHPRCITAMNKAYIEQKEEIKLKQIKAYIKNDSFHQWGISISKKALDLFSKLDDYFENKYIFKYGKKEGDKILNREQGIYVADLGMSNNRVRYLDFYFKTSEGIRIAFEFDEYYHDKIKQKDIIRENEIFIKRPNLILFRIKEEYYDNNFDVLFDDVVNLIENPYYKTKLNYDCLTKQLKNEKTL